MRYTVPRMKAHKLCANISTLLKKRLFMILAGVVLCCESICGATYIWTGAGGNSNWTTPGNWTSSDGGATYPSNADKVYIRSAATITLDADITIDGLSLGANNQSDDFAITITGSNTLTITGTQSFTENGADKGIVTYRPTNTGDTSKTSSLKLECNIISTNLAIHSGGNVELAGNSQITNITSMAANNNTPTSFKISGTLITEKITMAQYDNQKIEVSSSAIIVIPNSNDITYSDGAFSNAGNIVNFDSSGINNLYIWTEQQMMIG